eukprot:1064387-Rhodomonas_salina.3
MEAEPGFPAHKVDADTPQRRLPAPAPHPSLPRHTTRQDTGNMSSAAEIRNTQHARHARERASQQGWEREQRAWETGVSYRTASGRPCRATQSRCPCPGRTSARHRHPQVSRQCPTPAQLLKRKSRNRTPLALDPGPWTLNLRPLTESARPLTLDT